MPFKGKVLPLRNDWVTSFLKCHTLWSHSLSICRGREQWGIYISQQIKDNKHSPSCFPVPHPLGQQQDFSVLAGQVLTFLSLRHKPWNASLPLWQGALHLLAVLINTPACLCRSLELQFLALWSWGAKGQRLRWQAHRQASSSSGPPCCNLFWFNLHPYRRSGLTSQAR